MFQKGFIIYSPLQGPAHSSCGEPQPKTEGLLCIFLSLEASLVFLFKSKRIKKANRYFLINNIYIIRTYPPKNLRI